MNNGSEAKPNKFPTSLRVTHWAMAMIVVAMLFAGMFMIESLSKWQPIILSLHKSFGILALVLVIIRFVMRVSLSIPPLPQDLQKSQKYLAKISHVLLYALMFLIPTSGLLMQYFAARPVGLFEIVYFPASEFANIELYSLFREGHAYLTKLIIGLIVLHVIAALFHHFVRKDNVMKSML